MPGCRGWNIHVCPKSLSEYFVSIWVVLISFVGGGIPLEVAFKLSIGLLVHGPVFESWAFVLCPFINHVWSYSLMGSSLFCENI